MNQVCSNKDLVSILMKYLSPMSFSILKQSVPNFYRCSLVRDTNFIDFFKQKLLTNLIIYFGQTREAVKIANMIMTYLHSNGKRKILTGSFLLNTLNGDDIRLCGDIDIVTNVYSSYIEYTWIQSFPLYIFDQMYRIDNDMGPVSIDFKNPPNFEYEFDANDRHILKEICNVHINGKKIQFLNVDEENQFEYISKFDLPICKNSYCNGTLKVHHMASILKRSFNVNVSKTYLPRVMCHSLDFVYNWLCKSVYERLYKYTKRSYDIIIYTDMNVDNINVKKVSPRDNKILDYYRTDIFNQLKSLANHKCNDACTGASKRCTIYDLYDYVIKMEIIAIWRCFWASHIDIRNKILPPEEIQTNNQTDNQKNLESDKKKVKLELM